MNRTHKHFECKCPEGRGGTHCEFLKEEGFTDCRLECDNGTCAKGFKSYDELIGAGAFPAKLAFDIISSGGEHCVCPEGWTGLKCEIPVKKCSTKYCYNGASCTSDESGIPICDCNSAHTDDVSYAGMSCEQEGTSRCEPGFDQDHKDAFCTNHGKCIDDDDTRHKGCICEEGWSGDLCDIQGNDEPVCDLACENGGSCRIGVKGYKDTLDELLLPALAKKHENGMYCSCPENFTGVRCEVDVSHCHLDDGSKAGEADFCLNGVPCAPDNPEMDGVDKKFTCQCDQGTDEISQMLAGRFCEYAVTEYCSKDRARHSHSFCTNGGKCKKENDHDDSEHHGCCCPAGYEGEYCQLPQGTLDLESTSITWSPMYECNHKKSSSQQNGSASEHMTVFPVAPKPSGEWEHITINPKFEVPSNITEEIEEDDDEEYDDEEEPVLAKVTAPKYVEPQEENSSRTGGIVSGVLVTLLIVGVAGVVYKKRSMKEDPHQFATDWWQGHIGNWWQQNGQDAPDSPSESIWGDGSIEAGTNIARFRDSPVKTSGRKTLDSEQPAALARQWSYPEGHTLSSDSLDQTKKWEYNNDHGDLHDVVI